MIGEKQNFPSNKKDWNEFEKSNKTANNKKIHNIINKIKKVTKYYMYM